MDRIFQYSPSQSQAGSTRGAEMSLDRPMPQAVSIRGAESRDVGRPGCALIGPIDGRIVIAACCPEVGVLDQLLHTTSTS